MNQYEAAYKALDLADESRYMHSCLQALSFGVSDGRVQYAQALRALDNAKNSCVLIEKLLHVIREQLSKIDMSPEGFDKMQKEKP